MSDRSNSDQTPNQILNLDNLNPCGCCEDLPGLTNRVNRPGLPDISYRLGTYGSFMEQLIAQITRPVLPADELGERVPTLEALKTRELDDGAIALLDAWANVADVLTFYQERIANENYLRTATERRSVLELARAIGYELNPGVAASTYLAFTVTATPGNPEAVSIPQGLQVSSIPGQGELPQTFETMQDFLARPEWNALKPRLTQPQNLAFKGNQLYLWTVDADLVDLFEDASSIDVADLYFLGNPPASSVDRVTALPIEQIYLQGIDQNLRAGQKLLFVGHRAGEGTSTLVKSVQQLEKQPANNWTRVDFISKPKPITLFFANALLAIAPYTTVSTTISFTDSNILAQLNQPIRESNLQALLYTNQWSPQDFAVEAANPSPLEDSEDPEERGIFVFRQQLNCFGHNAPRYETLPVPDETRGGTQKDPYPSSWDGPNIPSVLTADGRLVVAPGLTPGGPRTVWENSQSVEYTGQDIYLERSVSEVVPKSWILLENGSKQAAFRVRNATEKSLVDYGISGKSTGLDLTDPSGSEPDKSNSFKVRETTVYAQSEKLALAVLPIDAPLEARDVNQAEADPVGVRSLELDTIVIGLQIDQPILIQGKREEAKNVTVAEVALLEEIVHEGTNTTLYFQSRLQYRYVRNSVTLYGNVVLATHGETVAEVLGSGDGSVAYQSFQLKKPPLTYTSADTPSGAQSSLSVRVNNILWSESRAFYGLDPDAERYIVRIEDDGATRITFGDSRQGSRLPTGSENITALYRSGIGPEGEVPADSLTLLKTRPLGVQTVVNPLPATGAEAPEQLATARTSAPLTVLTLDRIVSLQDYTDFARAFAGIGKAQAVSIWDGASEQIHLTVAAASGEPMSPDSLTYQNLIAAINNLRDSGPPFTIASFAPRSFNLRAGLRTDARYQAEDVRARVRAALLEAFSFEQRAFGQGVSAADVIALIQPVAGVIAVDLDQLHRTDKPVALMNYVGAAIARYSAGYIAPAELLLINPVGINLEVNLS